MKEVGWIRYSKTYKCFVTHHTSQAIETTHQHFQGLARIDSRYLYRPKRLRPTEGAVILLQESATIAEPLQKVPLRPVVRLQPLLHRGQEYVQLSYPYSKEIHVCLKHSQVARWLSEMQCFVIPTESSSLHNLLAEVESVAHVWLAQTMQVKDMILQAKAVEPQDSVQNGAQAMLPRSLVIQQFFYNFPLGIDQLFKLGFHELVSLVTSSLDRFSLFFSSKHTLECKNK